MMGMAALVHRPKALTNQWIAALLVVFLDSSFSR